MPNAINTRSPVAQKQAIGHLMYDAAVALDSTFGWNGTSAYPENVPGVLRDSFHYTCNDYEEKGSDSDEWYNMIKADIDANKPVFYAMWEDDDFYGLVNGHAVVCDGYQNGNEIHLNLGWSGSGNLWYNIDSVDYHAYTWTIHGAVFGITPPSDSTLLSITKMQVKLNFAKTNSDSCTLKATLDLGTGCNLTNATVNVGGANVPFILDSKGKGVSSFGNCKLAYNKKTGLWTLTVKLTKGSWQTQWYAYNLTNEDVARPGRSVTMPVDVAIIGTTDIFAGERTMLYRAKWNKSGIAK